MNINEFLDHLNSGISVIGGSEVHQFMNQVSHDALRITMELNNTYHTPGEIRLLMERLTGEKIDESFSMFQQIQ